MAITQLSDIVVPQVIADLTTDILFAKSRLLNSPYVIDATGNTYVDGGNTLTFPQWNTTITGIVQDQVVNSRTGVTPSKVSMTTYTETVQSKIVSFDLEKAIFQDIMAGADVNQHMAEIVARESQRTIQAYLLGKAAETTLYDEAQYLAGAGLTVDSIARAKGEWGEYADEDQPSLWCHSAQFTALAQTTDFKNLATVSIGNPLVNAAAAQGAVAMVHGVLIYTLDAVTRKGGTVSSITRSSSTATLTTTAAHNFVVGDKIVLSGADQTEYNGTFTILTVPTSTTMTFAVSGTPASPATGSPAIDTRYESLLLMPGALLFKRKQDVEGQTIFHAGSTVRTMDFDFRYAGTLRRVNPRPAIRFVTS